MKKINLKIANVNDSEIILNIRNQSSVRKFSFSKKISKNIHNVWFQKL